MPRQQDAGTASGGPRRGGGGPAPVHRPDDRTAAQDALRAGPCGHDRGGVHQQAKDVPGGPPHPLRGPQRGVTRVQEGGGSQHRRGVPEHGGQGDGQQRIAAQRREHQVNGELGAAQPAQQHAGAALLRGHRPGSRRAEQDRSRGAAQVQAVGGQRVCRERDGRRRGGQDSGPGNVQPRRLPCDYLHASSLGRRAAVRRCFPRWLRTPGSSTS